MNPHTEQALTRAPDKITAEQVNLHYRNTLTREGSTLAALQSAALAGRVFEKRMKNSI